MSAGITSVGRSALRSRAVRGGLLSAAALLFCAPQAAMAVTPGGPGDTGPIVSGVHSGKCVDDQGNGTANDTPVVIWECNWSHEQKWTVEPDGTIQINGKCLDVRRFGKKNKTLVELWTCTGGANQQWIPRVDGTVVSADSGKCLDLPRFDTTNGTQLEIYTCNGGKNQQWRVP